MQQDKIRKKIISFILLFLIFCFSFFIRFYFVYKGIFYDGVVHYGDDSMYIMRVFENMLLGGHFPKPVYFDSFTNFPHGTYSQIPSFLFNFLPAFFIWVVSFGKPTLELVNKIAPFYPVFLGSLIPIVIYFISNLLWGHRVVSLVSAFLVSISPPILFRSMFAMNDHHIAEILFSSLTIMFLLYALKNKKRWLSVALCGLSMGTYLFNWTGAILFLFIICCFIAIFYIVEFIKKKSANWILLAGFIIFLISLLMIFPFLGHPDLNLGAYNINHLIAFGLGFFAFLSFYICGLIVEKNNLKRWLIIILFLLSLTVLLLFIKIAFPYLAEKIYILAGGVNNNGLADGFKSFVSEMAPLEYNGAIKDFHSLFFLFIIGFLIVCCDYFKTSNPKHLLLIIWSAIAFLITGIIPIFGQQRFDIYLAVPVSIISAFIIVKGFDFGFKALNISSNLEKKEFEFKKYFLISSIVFILVLMFSLVYPFPFNAGLQMPESLPDLVRATLTAIQNPFTIKNDWYLLLSWLKNNTPDPGLDYYGAYKEPGFKNGVMQDYSYPQQAYSVLSHWENGHAIEYYGHRIPIANPFQQGIGRKINGKIMELGEGLFFLETNENKAVSYLDQLKARYVLTDAKFAILEFGLFDQMIKLVQGSMDGYIDEPKDSLTKYDNSMIARLHLLDGSQAIIEKKIEDKNIDLKIESLEHFRLLYESETEVTTLSYKDLDRKIKMAKAFEYVKGAHVKGFASQGTNIKISTEITTNQGRIFVYEDEKIVTNGSFEFIVPYSTGKQENSDVLATEYAVKIGNWDKKVKVSEEDILQGKNINL
jgi:dolichyl-diphosphooligosaccharide--protein glycosyltransferase